MNRPPRHRNISVKRLILDALQFVRTQSFICQRFGRPFRPSRRYVEIDITYKCNLKCINCNRSCAQASSVLEMPLTTIESFVSQSVTRKIIWERIRILGGEPTLHSRFLEIVDCLMEYRRMYNPAVKLVVGTNFYGSRVQRILQQLPASIVLKSTLKTSPTNLFRPFNVAPVDSRFNQFSDYRCGCRIIEDCGLGLTPSGYYMCAVAGGIDRIFNYHLGRPNLPVVSDILEDQMAAFCRWCGHFGFQWPTRKPRQSKSWQLAYAQQRLRPTRDGEGGHSSL